MEEVSCTASGMNHFHGGLEARGAKSEKLRM